MSSDRTTVRLEQRDPYLRNFRAHVTAAERVEGALWIALDRSAFYPESGGQPADAGRLGPLVVRDTQIREGVVWHRVEGGEASVGDLVEGEVDWERRFRHMQRHTAQHLLSQAFLRVDPAFTTESVSLSGPECTVDLAGAPSVEATHQAEALVNREAYADHEIVAFEVDEADLARYPLRRPPKVRGTVRLVAMGEFELSACGGTHVSRTAEAAPIKILGAENIRNALTRVTYRCGLEALEDYREKHDVVTRLALAFSARVAEVPRRVEALHELQRVQARELDASRARLADALAASWRAEAEHGKGFRVVRRAVAAEDAPLLDALGEALAAIPSTVALLGVASEGKARLLFTRSPDVDLDLRPVLAAALEAVDGRGGGRPERVQGGGPRSERLDAALDHAVQAVTQTRS